MSRFKSKRFKNLTPYTPGEQPKGSFYIKLNTNESPFPPPLKAEFYSFKAAEKLNLYPDPECRELTEKLAEKFSVDYDEVLVTNGSDEILNFAFMAFCDESRPAAFPDITYGFYPVFAKLNGVSYEEIPLDDNFNININDYLGINKTIFIANPNAPTGIFLPREKIEKILVSNPDSVVVIDEAYIDFGGESCIPLIHKYDNLLVTQTFSKSRSMAGARLGFGVGCKALIADLNTIKYSTNPYNINKMTMAAGLGALESEDSIIRNCRIIMENRKYTMAELKKLGFKVTDSLANFIFAKHPGFDGEEIYRELKNQGILVRHFKNPSSIADYVRITIGTKEQMDSLIDALKNITEAK